MNHPSLAPGRVAVITGGASGIGLAAAKRFSSMGMKVAIADLEQSALDGALVQPHIAHEPHDHIFPNVVVGDHAIARMGRRSARFDRGIVFGELFGVLLVALGEITNGGHAKSVQITARLGRIALEIALQGAVALGHGELIRSLREVIHPNIPISGRGQLFRRGNEHIDLLFHRGQCLLGDDLLMRLQPRDMGVMKDCQTIGVKQQNLAHRLPE